MHRRKITCETTKDIAVALGLSCRSVERFYQSAVQTGLLNEWLSDQNEKSPGSQQRGGCGFDSPRP
jgi:hypothetical protein